MLLCVLQVQSDGQSFHFKFHNYTIDNGLSQNMVYAICQDGQGFMWFGTKDGLNRYDGYQFVTYHHDPFDSSTLSDNAISAVFCDSKGRLWIGTMNGSLDLYDSDKDRFRHFLKDNFNQGNVNAIAEDAAGHLWVGTYGNGIYELIFDNNHPEKPPVKIVHHVHQPGEKRSINNNFILDIFPDRKGRLWISTVIDFFQYAELNGTKLNFHKINVPIFQVAKKINAGEIQFDMSKIQPVSKKEFKSGGGRFAEDASGRLWIGTPSGFFLLNTGMDTLFSFDPLIPPLLKEGNAHVVRRVTYVSQGIKSTSLWMGFVGGLGVLNTDRFLMKIISHDPGARQSLVPGTILTIFQDRSGCVWLGSNGSGLSKFNPRSTLFPLPEFHTPDGKLKTSDLSVRSFNDAKEYLLIGTTIGLMVANKNTGIMKQWLFKHEKDPPNLIFCISSTDSDSYWLGANSGLFLLNLKNNTAQRFSPKITGNGQTDNRIFKLYNDGHGYLWCLTPYGLSTFNISEKSFTNYLYSQKPVNRFSEPGYGDIVPLSNGNFWLGTSDGLMYFDRQTQKFTSFTFNVADTSSLSFNAVRSLLPDPVSPDTYLWIGTAGGGLNKFDLLTKKFRHFTVSDGLANNVVYGILPDRKGNLWMSTNNGISRFNPSTETFTNFNSASGLQSNEFNSGAFCENKQGKIFFGGIAGFNAFYPDKILPNPRAPAVVFTGFRVGNHLVTINDKNSPLQKPIFETDKITLPFTDNNISFEIAGLDYSNPSKIQYAYRLEPANRQWIQMGTNRIIVFSNLNPGRYVLQVKAANTDGAWPEKSTSLNLIITPPWWKTWWATVIFAVALITALLLLRKYEMNRIRLRNRLKLEHLQAQKLREIDASKSRFFANISHEFRTPLTLIIGPVEDLLQKKETQKFKPDLSRIGRNAKRLLQLVNQLLDLSKLDAHNYAIQTCREDIIPFVKQIVHSFSSMAHLKNIELEVEIDPRLKNKLRDEEIAFYFDEDILEKILSNLLSNAFKFTSEGGQVTVALSLPEKEEAFLELKVEDNGVGIAPDKFPHIFERFYQADEAGVSPFDGSGIGLSLVRELIHLHGGSITAKSNPGVGTVFTCLLPLNKKIDGSRGAKKPGQASSKFVTVSDSPEEVTAGAEDITRQVILVVEDQPDVRRYLRDRLTGDYTVLEAKDGAEGLATARDKIPDLVISDVMMPEMDGFEFCRLLKTDIVTSHIPVILLTARADDADKLSGLETGADAYLIKPFNTRELLLRTRNLIDVRNKMRAKFSEKLIVKPSEITITSQDSRFVQGLLETVEKHLDDEKFSVEKLGQEFGMSTSQINRKLKALINQSAQQFIRSVRMQRAKELLDNNACSVAEVAYQVGFSDAAYFSRVFKRHFGYSPSEEKK